MKALWIMIGISLALVGVCYALSQYIVTTCDEFIKLKEETRQAAVRGDFETASELIDTMQSQWQEIEHIWEMICNHDDLNIVTAALSRSKILCEQRDAHTLELECAQIEAAFINISHKEKVQIENII